MLPFSWTVSRDGSEWVSPAAGYNWWPTMPECGDDLWGPRYVEPGPRTTFLSTGLPTDRRHPCWSYQPLQNPALYQNFADTQPTKEGILQFANKHGLLLRDLHYYAPHPDGWPVPDTWDFEHTLLHPEVDAGKGTRPFVYGESLYEWQVMILEMRQVIELWDMVRKGKRDTLSSHIRWQRPNEVFYDSHPDLSPQIFSGFNTLLNENEKEIFLHTREWIAAPTLEDWPLLDRIQKGDCIQAAIFYIRRRIRAHLGQDILHDILPHPHQPHQSDVGLRPLTLKSALWLQFAYAVAENRNYRRCLECATWFEVAESRHNRFYCETSACRNKAYRNRKERAKEMHRNGMNTSDIAERVGSTVGTVEKWIKEPCRPKRPRGRPRTESSKG